MGKSFVGFVEISNIDRRLVRATASNQEPYSGQLDAAVVAGFTPRSLRPFWTRIPGETASCYHAIQYQQMVESPESPTGRFTKNAVLDSESGPFFFFLQNRGQIC